MFAWTLPGMGMCANAMLCSLSCAASLHSGTSTEPGFLIVQASYHVLACNKWKCSFYHEFDLNVALVCRHSSVACAAADAAAATQEGEEESKLGLERVQEETSRALEDLVLLLPAVPRSTSHFQDLLHSECLNTSCGWRLGSCASCLAAGLQLALYGPARCCPGCVTGDSVDSDEADSDLDGTLMLCRGMER